MGWLAVLRDDSAGGQKWLNAARSLTYPYDAVKQGLWYTFGSRTTKRAGDLLRDSHCREVANLMSKRALETGLFSIGKCLTMWDRHAAFPTLRLLCESNLSAAKEQKWQETGSGEYSQAPSIAAMIGFRARVGDLTAASDFATLGGLLSFSGATSPRVLAPMWLAPKDRAIQAVGRSILLQVDRKLEERDSFHRGVWFLEAGLRMPLVGVEEFRDILVKVLDSKTAMGIATVETISGRVKIKYTFIDGGGGMVDAPQGAVMTPDAGTWSYTTGDMIAQFVSRLKGAPPFVLAWDPVRKREAKTAITSWLQDK